MMGYNQAITDVNAEYEALKISKKQHDRKVSEIQAYYEEPYAH